MSQNQEVVKRGRGRPPVRSEEETRRKLIEAAALEFQAKGFDAAGMEAIAQRAEFSTRTIYQAVSTKTELFEMVVSDRIGRFMLTVDASVDDMLDPLDALTRMLIAYGNLTLPPEVIAITRLVISEGERFPEIAAAFHARAVERTNGLIEAWLVRQRDKGLIELSDATSAAGMLRGMMIMDPQRAVFMGRGKPPSAEEIVARAKACAHL